MEVTKGIQSNNHINVLVLPRGVFNTRCHPAGKNRQPTDLLSESEPSGRKDMDKSLDKGCANNMHCSVNEND